MTINDSFWSETIKVGEMHYILTLSDEEKEKVRERFEAEYSSHIYDNRYMVSFSLTRAGKYVNLNVNAAWEMFKRGVYLGIVYKDLIDGDRNLPILSE